MVTVASTTAPAAEVPADRAMKLARIGIAVAKGNGAVEVVRNAEERFAMCSTFKFLAVAAVLHRVDIGEEKLDRFITYGESDLLEWAPITRQHLSDGGMRIEDLCFAAIAYSDNTAANLLLRILDGPAGVTSYARSLGDKVTRLDRTEPDLNDVAKGDERDTTTPAAMVRDMQEILLGGALSEISRGKLESWMIQNTTGQGMIRASTPKGWRIGDKTGRNNNSNSNDIAIVRPLSGPPILLAIYVELPNSSADERSKIIADFAADLLTRH